MTKDTSTVVRAWKATGGLAAAGGLVATLFGGAVLTQDGCLPDGPKVAEVPVDMTPVVDAGASLTAKQMFNTQVLPLLTSTCGACHSREVGVGPGFLRTGSADPTVYDPYPIVTTWNNFIVSSPELSALLTKGQHEGPSLSMDQYNATLAWLQQEKKERDAVTVIPFKPQVPPFSVAITTDKANPKYNVVNIDTIDSSFAGANLRFIATTLSPAGTGLEISDLRFINVKPNPQPGEQRAIHFQSPLFVLWRGGQPYPDPANSFGSADRTVSLNQDDITGGPGVIIIPGILILDQYRTGYSLSVAFSIIELVKPVAGANPCNANQLSYFTTNLANTYLSAASSCTQSGQCHNSAAKVAGVDISPTLVGGSNLSSLCEQLKFYNGLSIIQHNMDPNATYNHPFKWTASNCTANGFTNPGAPTNTCFTDFSSKLDTWRTQ